VAMKSPRVSKVKPFLDPVRSLMSQGAWYLGILCEWMNAETTEGKEKD
jgi:hypothetical protein